MQLLPATSEPARIYLVTIVTEQRARLFDELLLARMLVRHLKEHEFVTTLAYVVMPDHVHWLLKLKDDRALESVVRSAKSRSAGSINRFYGRNGRVWQKGFHDYSVHEQDDLKYIARYLVRNPVRAGLAKSVRDYSHWDAIWL